MCIAAQHSASKHGSFLCKTQHRWGPRSTPQFDDTTRTSEVHFNPGLHSCFKKPLSECESLSLNELVCELVNLRK